MKGTSLCSSSHTPRTTALTKIMSVPHWASLPAQTQSIHLYVHLCVQQPPPSPWGLHCPWSSPPPTGEPDPPYLLRLMASQDPFGTSLTRRALPSCRTSSCLAMPIEPQ